MVGVAQLAEHLVVVQDVAGSSPVTHPNFCERNLELVCSWTEMYLELFHQAHQRRVQIVKILFT